jgi:ATP-dependent Clp protease adapter protein ClpS
MVPESRFYIFRRVDMKKTMVITEIQTTPSVELGNPWQTVLFNDEVHSFDEVILQVQKAAGYSLEKAVEITLRVHNNGKAIVKIGSKLECEKVAVVLGQIQLTTSVEKT